MRRGRSFVDAEPPSHRAQHPSEAIQPEQPAAVARVPHPAGLDHHRAEPGLHGDPGAEAVEPARPDLLRKRRWGRPDHARPACWRSRPGQADPRRYRAARFVTAMPPGTEPSVPSPSGRPRSISSPRRVVTIRSCPAACPAVVDCAAASPLPAEAARLRRRPLPKPGLRLFFGSARTEGARPPGR